MNIGGGGGRRGLMSEINVTPMVDVMLVLLIIFMVTAPMLQEGIGVNVPKVKAATVEQSHEEQVVLVIDKEGRMTIKKKTVTMDTLSEELKSIFVQRADKTLFLRADKDVAYGRVVEAMAIGKLAGAEKLSMITQPPEDKK